MISYTNLTLALALLALPALACDKVEYAEAKTWSTAKLQQAYCADLQENGNRLLMNLNGTAGYDSRAAEVCAQQMALYKRLLESHGKAEFSCK